MIDFLEYLVEASFIYDYSIDKNSNRCIIFLKINKYISFIYENDSNKISDTKGFKNIDNWYDLFTDIMRIKV